MWQLAAKSEQQNWKTKNDGLLLKVKQGQFVPKLVRLGWLVGWLVGSDPIERETFEQQMQDKPLLKVEFRSLKNGQKEICCFH